MDYLLQCMHKVPPSQLMVHIIAHHRKIRNHLNIYKHLRDWVPAHMFWISDVGKKFLGDQGLRAEDFAKNLISLKISLEELGLLVVACMYHTYFSVILKDRLWCTTDDNSSKYCKFFLMYQGGVSFVDTVTGNWDLPSPPAVLLTIDDDIQEEAVNLVADKSHSQLAKTSQLLPLDMQNKDESEPELDSDVKIPKKDLSDKVKTDSLQISQKEDLPEKEKPDSFKSSQKEDLSQSPTKEKMDSDSNVNPQKLDLDVSNKKGTVAAGKLKIEYTNTQTQKRQSRPRKRMSPSERCLRSSGSVCNKKPRKEQVSKNSQKAGKNVYDLCDLIRGKRPHQR